MKDINLTLTANEASVLVNIIDAAVKAVGLQLAETAVFFQRKIAAAQAEAEQDHPVGMNGSDASAEALAN